MTHRPHDARVLVVDDEPQIRRFLRTALVAHGYHVDEAESAGAALKRIAIAPPSVVVLDLGLPDLDGLEALGRIRGQTDVPVVVLSARGEEATKIAALDAGADDYVTKPFGVGELTARLRAALRHHGRPPAEAVWSGGDLVVDVADRRVTRAGQVVHLSPREWDVLRLLVLNSGKVLTHSQMLKALWGPAHQHEVQYLRVYVGQLRQKLEPDPARPRHILTEPGVGYRLVSE
jgi:two-component system KDP operon response regulator KdpE